MIKILDLKMLMVLFSICFIGISCNNKTELLEHEIKINNEFYKDEFNIYFNASKYKVIDLGFLALIEKEKKVKIIYYQLDLLSKSKQDSDSKLIELQKIIKMINIEYNYKIKSINNNSIDFLNENLKKDYIELLINRTKYILCHKFYFQYCSATY